MPKHGDERDRHEETTYGNTTTYREQDTGFPVYTMPASSNTETVTEKYCDVCKDWFKVRGVIGVLHWESQHRHDE